MFSEYASRFLSQSQSRLSPGGFDEQAGPLPSNDRALSRDRHQPDGGRGLNLQKSFLSRGYGGNPYQQPGGASRIGSLGFTSRFSGARDAPLFHSALDELGDEDESERHGENTDILALRRSRRMAVTNQLDESVESGPSHASVVDSSGGIRLPPRTGPPGRSTRNDWGEGSSTLQSHPARRLSKGGLEEGAKPEALRRSRDDFAIRAKSKMVDVGLDSHDDDEDPPESLLGGEVPSDEGSPLPFQTFKSHGERAPFIPQRQVSVVDTDDVAGLRRPDLTRQDREEDGQRPDAYAFEGELFRHDPFFAYIFLISLAGLAATFFFWLQTSPRKSPVGDTIYTTLQQSFHMLAVDTVVSVSVSLVWLATLRSFVRPLVSVILVAVPVIMMTFSLYTFASSYRGRTHGSGLQDLAMRCASLLPAGACILWLWLVVKGRAAIQQAIDMLQFACKILAQNPGLLLVGFGCLGLIVAWTWVWLAMFTRVFMGGYFSKSLVRFVIQLSSWWLGAAFIFMYLWTLSAINAVHRAAIAATVSQWYFHRNAGPVTPSRETVLAALHHATTTLFGSICESTLLSLLVRAPLLFLPSRLGSAISNVAAFWIPMPVFALTNPLTVTYAAIHSQNLAAAARGIDQMEVVSAGTPTTTLTPRTLRVRGQARGLLPYRLAKLLLVATRLVMATALGLAGWVLTAKQLRIELPDGMGVRGSAYAYIVGIMASFIGYSVMGAMEGILSGILDAVLICYGSERRMEPGHGRFCLEAAYLFGERRI